MNADWAETHYADTQNFGKPKGDYSCTNKTERGPVAGKGEAPNE